MVDGQWWCSIDSVVVLNRLCERVLRSMRPQSKFNTFSITVSYWPRRVTNNPSKLLPSHWPLRPFRFLPIESETLYVLDAIQNASGSICCPPLLTDSTLIGKSGTKMSAALFPVTHGWAEPSNGMAREKKHHLLHTKQFYSGIIL